MKPATRSSRSAYRLVLMCASGVWVSACSPDGAPNRSAEVPDAPPTRWMGLIGEYGPYDDTWLILEDDSRLHLRHGEMAYPLEEVSADEFLHRPSGAEATERLLFTRRGDGRAAGLQLGGAHFTRREIGTVGGEHGVDVRRKELDNGKRLIFDRKYPSHVDKGGRRRIVTSGQGGKDDQKAHPR